jgi:REP element-mobilizing transposase RayT
MGAKRAKHGEQLTLHLPTWGGRRENAGRKRTTVLPTVPHEVREEMDVHEPVHVTLRVVDRMPDLRSRKAWETIVRVLQSFRGNEDVRVVHYAVLRNHLHLIVECSDRVGLGRGMRTLNVWLARQLNQTFGRRGRVFAGRYHARALTTPTEVRNALRYVLLNARHHVHESGIDLPRDWIDPRSSGVLFDGWCDPPALPEPLPDLGPSPAQSWICASAGAPAD